MFDARFPKCVFVFHLLFFQQMMHRYLIRSYSDQTILICESLADTVTQTTLPALPLLFLCGSQIIVSYLQTQTEVYSHFHHPAVNLLLQI